MKNQSQDYFVGKNSIVREIWGKGDTILFIFAGAAAEFALNKSVDWLYFTGKLPADPLGRLFTTVTYARSIVFSEKHVALKSIDAMNKIHADVENKRGAKIPDWAYRDVLFMLIDYSIRSYETLERKLTPHETHEVFDVFYRMGTLMHIVGLPKSFAEWQTMRREHLDKNLLRSHYTDDLYKQYRKHLGLLRYIILIETQSILAPAQVRHGLGFRNFSLMQPVIVLYKFSKQINLDGLLKVLTLPSRYKKEILALDYTTTQPT